MNLTIVITNRYYFDLYVLSNPQWCCWVVPSFWLQFFYGEVL